MCTARIINYTVVISVKRHRHHRLLKTFVVDARTTFFTEYNINNNVIYASRVCNAHFRTNSPEYNIDYII